MEQVAHRTAVTEIDKVTSYPAIYLGGFGMMAAFFAMLTAAAAFTLDEPASLVVDVTPTGAFRRTAVRALALLVPLTAGALLLPAGAMRGLALPWGSTALALAGNVLLGFAVAAVGRTRTGEPGAAASAGVVLILIVRGGRRRIRQRTAAPWPPVISTFSPQCLFLCGASARSASNATRPARRETSHRTANSALSLATIRTDGGLPLHTS